MPAQKTAGCLRAKKTDAGREVFPVSEPADDLIEAIRD